MSYIRIPVWIVYRSALIPCDIFGHGVGGYELLLVSEQPVPKLQIKRMMKRGVNWLYIEYESVSAYKNYLDGFLADPSTPGWVLEIIYEDKLDQLEFPEGVKIPEVVSNAISAAQLDARAAASSSTDVQTSSSADYGRVSVAGGAGGQSSGNIFVRGQSADQPAELNFVTSVRKFKEELIMVTQGGNVSLSSPQDLKQEIGKLKRELSVFESSGALMERLNAIDEFLDDIDGDQNWQQSLGEVVDEMSVMELSMDHSETTVDTGLDLSSEELSELYKYKGRLEEENRQARDEIMQGKTENADLKEQIERLTGELQSINQQYQKLQLEFERSEKDQPTAPALGVGKKIHNLEMKVKDLRETNVRQKMDMGKLISRNQEVERKYKTKEAQCKVLHQKIEGLQSKRRTG